MAPVKGSGLEAYKVNFSTSNSSPTNPFGLKDFSKLLDQKFGESAFSSKVLEKPVNQLKSHNVFDAAPTGKSNNNNPFGASVNNSNKIQHSSASIYSSPVMTASNNSPSSIFGGSFGEDSLLPQAGGSLFDMCS